MSIHKSKGLEFPVVFVCGLAREFNRESAREQVLCDQQLGLGLSAVDQINRLRYPTVAKRAIGAKILSDSLSEELRVLYVALTRARDRLIMTYASRNLQKDISELALRMDLSEMELLTRDVICPGQWVLMAALRRTEAGEMFALGGRPKETTLGDPVWQIRVVKAEEKAEAAVDMPDKHLPEETVRQMARGLAFRYGQAAATQAPSKQTATQRKGRIKDAEAEEGTQEPKNIRRNWRKPSFAQQSTDGADRGNATHAVMQYLRYDACDGESSVAAEVQRLVQENFITLQQAQLVDCRQIAAFFASEFGKKLRSSNNVLREFKFSILDDGAQFDPELENEKILLQGVVDCALIEDDGITIVDFKTDRVTEGTLVAKTEHYRPQVMTYADAMGRIYGKPVKEALLYFLSMDRFVKVL